MRHFTVDLDRERSAALEAALFDTPPSEGQPTPLEHPRPTMIVTPGGGYIMLSWWEPDPVTITFLHHGFSVFVLRYSLREHAVYPDSAIDVAQTVWWTRTHTGEVGVDPWQMNLLGFSTSGRITALLGAHRNRDDLAAAEYTKHEVTGRGDLLRHDPRSGALVICHGAFSVD